MSCSINTLIRAAVVVSLVAATNGCGTMGAASITPQQEVKESAKKKWDALIAKNFDAAYKHYSSGSKTLISLEKLAGNPRVGDWRSVDVDEPTCSEDTCNVVVVLKYDFRGFEGVQTRISESWIKENGVYRFVAPR